MIRPGCWVLALALAAAPPLGAQVDSGATRREQGAPVLVHYGKWVAAAAAVAFTALGAHEHSNSNRVWTELLSLCRANNADCRLGADGRYANPAAEQLYQSSLTFDRRARGRLLAGQASLLVAASLFILDLRHHSGGPGNIPFAPLELSGDVGTGLARLGVRLAF
ncbi:MAG TPA: hypothetical protein VH116_11560 [Gemmatimonadales bacterium]|jgi:hypothetical protein|nr:hypothetical protein [Gemmatimonadales bacterium]